MYSTQKMADGGPVPAIPNTPVSIEAVRIGGLRKPRTIQYIRRCDDG
jgi:hypothetical protein